MLDLETIFNLQHGDVLHVVDSIPVGLQQKLDNMLDEYQPERIDRRPVCSTCQRWRVTGKVQRWKRDPERFRVPLKHGLYDYGALLPGDERRCHLESECTAIGGA